MLEDSGEGRDSRCHTVQTEHEAPSCHPQDASEGKVPWKALSCSWKEEGQGTATLYARLIPSHHSYDRGQISFSSPPAATEGREAGSRPKKEKDSQQTANGGPAWFTWWAAEQSCSLLGMSDPDTVQGERFPASACKSTLWAAVPMGRVSKCRANPSDSRRINTMGNYLYSIISWALAKLSDAKFQ